MTGILNLLAGALGRIPSDDYFEYTTLLLPGNGTNGAQNNTFLDGSTNNFTITRNGNTTQGTFSPFSQTGWGNYFNGSSYLSAGTTLFNYTTGNASTTTFTIEAFIYLNSYQTTANVWHNPCIIGKGDVYLNLGVNGSGNLTFYHFDGTVRSITGSSVIPLATWTYVAVTVTGGTATLYVNGTSVGSGTWYGIQAAGQNTTSLIGRASTNASSLYINGYISNLRVSTVARTIATPTTAYTNDANTALLTAQSNRFIDNSSSPITLTITGSPTVVAFSPFNPSASWSAATYGGSGYFDGSGDYLTLSPGAAFAFGSGDFTVELFVYITASAANYYLIDARNASQTTNWFMNISGANVWQWYNTLAILSGGNPVLNQWNHVVYVRSGTTGSLFINGSRTATQTDSYNYSTSPTTSYIASRYSATEQLTGYISNLRIVKGSAVYDPTLTTLTVPTAPLTAITNTSLLLNFTNAGVYDATSKNDLETLDNTVNGVRISTTQSKFGGSSIYFDGTGTDYLWIQADQPIQRFGTAPFTIEMWIRLAALGSARGLVAKGTSTTGWLVSLNTSNQVVFTYGTSTITSTGTISQDVWTYIAVVREGTSTNQTKIYIGGVNDGTGTVSTDFTQTSSMYIGANRTGGDLYSGYIQDVRITNGYARTVTTVPTSAFPTL